jgi:hypothetical protein
MNEMEPENSKNIKNQMVPEETKSIKNSRLTELEVIINTLNEKLEAQEKLIADLQCKADLHATNASKNNDYLSSKIDSVNVNLQERLYKLESRFECLLLATTNICLDFESQKKEIENLQNNLLSANSQLDSISHVLTSVCHQDQLTEIKANFESLRDECKQSQSVAHVYMVDLFNECKKENQILTNDFKNNADIRHAEDIKIKHDLQGLQVAFNQQISNQDASLKNLFNTLISAIDEKINAIPQPVIPSLDDAKNAMRQQLEPVILDAKNANLRSTNTDTKVHVLEKKLEQLKLMVDQINLQG